MPEPEPLQGTETYWYDVRFEKDFNYHSYNETKPDWQWVLSGASDSPVYNREDFTGDWPGYRKLEYAQSIYKTVLKEHNADSERRRWRNPQIVKITRREILSWEPLDE